MLQAEVVMLETEGIFLHREAVMLKIDCYPGIKNQLFHVKQLRLSFDDEAFARFCLIPVSGVALCKGFDQTFPKVWLPAGPRKDGSCEVRQRHNKARIFFPNQAVTQKTEGIFLRFEAMVLKS